jgi:hypothetical protein
LLSRKNNGGAIPKVKINQSEGLAEFPPHPPSAKPEHRIEPRHLLEYLRAETRRKILFSLGKKEIGRAQNEKSKEYFPAGHASEASGGGAVQSVFRSKKVRAKDIISPHFLNSPGYGLFLLRSLLIRLCLWF